MKRFLYALGFLAAVVCAPRAAHAACNPVPYTFVDNVSFLTAATTNTNNATLYACATNVDSTQIGTNGIYASQIKPTSGAQATFGGSQIYTFPSTITLGSPLPPASGGLGPLTNVPINPGDLIIGFGDSLINNTAGPMTCSAGTGSHTPTGTCMLDVLGENTSANVANLGIGGSCLEQTATMGSQCNSASSGIARYTNSFSAGQPGFSGLLTSPATTWILIDYGMNDWLKIDPATSAQTYFANFNTIVQWLISQGMPSNHIIINSMTPVNPNSGSAAATPQQGDIATQAAKVALANRTLFADQYSLLAPCWPGNSYQIGANCSVDGVHPNVAGSITMAGAALGASFAQALAASQASVWYAAIQHQAQLISPTFIGTTALSNIAATFASQPAHYTQINISGATKTAALGPFGATVNGVLAECFGVAQYGGGTVSAQDCSGNMGLVGQLNVGGAVFLTPANSQNQNGLVIGNSSAAGGAIGSTRIGTITACSAGGVTAGTVLSIDDQGAGYRVCVDQSGNMGISGGFKGTLLSVSGNVTSTSGTFINGTAGTQTNTGYTMGNASTNVGSAQITRIASISSCSAGGVTSQSIVSIDDESAGYRMCLKQTGDLGIAGSLLQAASSITLGGAGGATYSFGSGAPGGACVNGSLYVRTDGGAGSSTYDCRGTTWQALSGG